MHLYITATCIVLMTGFIPSGSDNTRNLETHEVDSQSQKRRRNKDALNYSSDVEFFIYFIFFSTEATEAKANAC